MNMTPASKPLACADAGASLRMNNYFKSSNNSFLPRFVSSIFLVSTPSLFKNLSSLLCLLILAIIFFSSETVDFGTSNNDVLL
jgi:hypothetical protein